MATTKQKLIIVESPAKARTISKFLGKGYKVEASQGHVRDLPKSQLGVDTEDDFALKYITIRGRGDILTRIRKEARSASQIYLATDPDREGEAISWHLANILDMDVNKPCRIEFHEVTKKAIQAAIKTLKFEGCAGTMDFTTGSNECYFGARAWVYTGQGAAGAPVLLDEWLESDLAEKVVITNN